MTRLLAPAAALIPLLGAGCSSAPAAPAQPRPRVTHQNPWASCYFDFVPAGNPKGNLARLTRACGHLAGLHPITPVRTKYQRQEDPADCYTFYVPSAGSCYRVFAAADDHVEDLDLLLRGPDGDDVAADLTNDAWPVLPPHGPLCFDTPGLYMLEVSVFRGAGYYSVQIWGG